MGIAVTISLSIYFYRLGVFDDMNSLQQLVGQSPIAGPLIFVLIQIIQVVIPIIPDSFPNGTTVWQAIYYASRQW